MLQAISADLVGDAVAPAFLIEIEQNPAAGLGHAGEASTKLVPAIAAKRPEQIPRETCRMQAHQHRPGRIGIADDDGDLLAHALATAEDHELSVACGQQRDRRTRDDRDLGRTTLGEFAYGIAIHRNCRQGSCDLRRYRGDQHGREQQGQPCQLNGALGTAVDGKQILAQALVTPGDQRHDPVAVELAAFDGHGAVETGSSKRAQSRGRQHQHKRTRRDLAQRCEQIGVTEFRRHGNHLAAIVLENDGTPGAEFGNRALDRHLVVIAKQA